MDLAAYLARIAYQGPAEPTTAALRAVQRAHLLQVPFENLDIHLARPIVLDESALYTKIVNRRRGGFCYEINGLLAWALQAMGFQVQRLSAQGANDDGSFAPAFDHLCLRVQVPREAGPAWLVDAGWGNGPLEPLRLVEGSEQAQDGRVFRLRRDAGFFLLEERGARGLEGEGSASSARWVRHYRFNLQPHPLSDFAGMCHYHQTSPESLFTRKRLVSRFTPGGRITLSDQRLIETTSAGRSERLLASPGEVEAVLAEKFGIRL